MQLVQFLLILAQNLVSIVAPSGEMPPVWLNYLFIAYMLSMLFLFGRFYLSNYKTAASKTKGAAIEKKD